MFADVLQSYGVARSGEVHANLGRHAHLASDSGAFVLLASGEISTLSPPLPFFLLSTCEDIYTHTHTLGQTVMNI